MLGQLFFASELRDVLAHLLKVAEPPVFGTVARLNWHCAKTAKSVKKIDDWLVARTDIVAGEIIVSRRFKDTLKPHGVCANWRVDGSDQITEYYNGQRRGLSIEPVLRIRAFTRGLFTYADDQKHGPFAIFWVDPETLEFRRLLEMGSYKNGRLDGQYLRWSLQGVLVEESHFRDGQFHGLQRQWDLEGKLYRIIEYKHGAFHGRYMSRDNNEMNVIYCYEGDWIGNPLALIFLDYSDILARILMFVGPSDRGAIACVNKHCSRLAVRSN